MRWTLRPETGVPIYRQVADSLREAISAGVLGANDEVPSARVLAGEIGVNYHTIGKAFLELEGDGLLIRQRGGNFRVAAGADRDAAARLLSEKVADACDTARAQGHGPAHVYQLVDLAFRVDSAKESS